MVCDAMRRLEEVFMLPFQAPLDQQMLSRIKLRGFSRIPVYDGPRFNMIGILESNVLEKMPMEEVAPNSRSPIVVTHEETSLPVLFEKLKQCELVKLF